MMARPVKRRGIACPHCGDAVIYTSRSLSPIAWEKYHQCTNLECRHQFVSQTGIHSVPDAFTAHAIAAAALAEVQSRTRPAWIDISLPTSLVCRVVNPLSGQVATFTATELIQIAEDRFRALSGTEPEGEPRRVPRNLN